MKPRRAPEESLADRVRIHCPESDETEFQHRVTLLRAQDYAMALRGSTDSRLAYDCAGWAIDVAGQFAFRRGESLVRLEEAARLARGLLSAAMRAAALNDMDTPL